MNNPKLEAGTQTPKLFSFISKTARLHTHVYDATLVNLGGSSDLSYVKNLLTYVHIQIKFSGDVHVCVRERDHNQISPAKDLHVPCKKACCQGYFFDNPHILCYVER